MATAAAACWMLQACAAAAQQAAHPGQIQVRDDKFQPYREYTTGRVRAGAHPNLLALELNGRIDRRSGALTTLLSVEFAYMSGYKRGYETARNSRAEVLHLTKLSSSGRCPSGSMCAYGEVFTVEIPEAELRQAAPEGYQLKVFARTGPAAVVTIPKAQIAALLARIDADRATRTKPGVQRTH
ncbi:MAG: hypothetical protein K2X43_25185 [Hyphomonadaceae bacterium]|nr:hypothetical protein [Hyphomonadaceae bacterium]